MSLHIRQLFYTNSFIYFIAYINQIFFQNVFKHKSDIKLVLLYTQVDCSFDLFMENKLKNKTRFESSILTNLVTHLSSGDDYSYGV